MNENKTNINCDTGILWKMHSNYWKYSFFNVEIFTYLIKWGEWMIKLISKTLSV